MTGAPRVSSSKPSSIAAAVRWRRCWCSAARSRSATFVVAGTEFARVRALINDKGEQVKEAGPSIPVEVLGFTGVPSAGDRFSVVENEARAREVTEYRQRLMREKTAGGGATSLEQMMNQLKASGICQVPADHQGRRAGLGRSDQRLAQQALDRRSVGADPDVRRRRHHRIRRDAGLGLERPSSSASTSAPTSRRRNWRPAKASKSATTTSSTTSWMT